MIHHLKGNLLTSDCKFLIHQSNCLGGFGSGIAGQIRQQFPKVYQAFKADPRTPKEKLGDYSFGIDKDKIIFNLYGQFHFGGSPNTVYTDYNAFEEGLDKVLNKIQNMQKYYELKGSNTGTKIGIPYLIGCGLAGGDWDIVYKIIEKISTKYGVDIYLYEFTP